MKNKDVKIGMKVVPFRKTVRGWSNLKNSAEWSDAKKEKQPFLYVHYFDDEEQAWVLGHRKGNRKTLNGDFFRVSDFKPYEPPV